MSTLPDVSTLSPSEVTELIKNCTDRIEALRQEHIQEAELLGLHCALPDGKHKKPRRTASKHQQD